MHDWAMLVSVPWEIVATILAIARWRDLPQRFWILYCVNGLLAYASLPIYRMHFGWHWQSGKRPTSRPRGCAPGSRFHTKGTEGGIENTVQYRCLLVRHCLPFVHDARRITRMAVAFQDINEALNAVVAFQHLGVNAVAQRK